MTAFDLEVEVSCAVRNELNGLRRADEVVYTCAEDGVTDVEPYYPRTFPCGSWLVGDVEEVDPRYDPKLYKWPYFIEFPEACQRVEAWALKDGKYWRKTGFLAWDYGYGMHHSSSPTTLGCIRVHALPDIKFVVEELARYRSRGLKPYIRVRED
jgi:hypothetical protein